MVRVTKVWAHRGASGSSPENTLPAFEMAIEQGADGLEFDVQLTRDDHVVVIHDETLERTTDGRGWVADHSLEDLRRLDAGAGHEGFEGVRIPTLAEVFDLVRDADVRLNVELKNSRIPYQGLEERVLAIIDDYGLADRVIVSSFDHNSLRGLAESGTTLPLGILYSEPLWRPWNYAVKLGASALHPSLSATRPKVVERSHEAGLEVNVWTVNEPVEVERVRDLGVDALITNFPARAREVLNSR
ncbi:glycerophosphodiester phosphodiesterase [Propioniciclava coleopterorum]|uniref:glycerophosphodiester phosphodiesterase n=1 Tax=Propioniciclava coleopterorum TaxID=2714937 RepID=UPI0025461CBB|nr:glycerophosphodiester phosphodiesterase [Propioniciclava coleopterorum]